MANLIDYRFFVNEINVPNANNNNPSAPIPHGGELETMITKHEPAFLEAILGYGLYKEFKAGLLEETVDAKWTNLKLGAEYTDVRGDLQKYIGLQSDTKISPIANYIYVQLLSHRASMLTGIGTKGTASENSVAVSPIHKQVPAWNAMVDMNFKMHEFLTVNKAEYPTYIGLKYNPCGYCLTDEICERYPNLKLFVKRNTWNI